MNSFLTFQENFLLVITFNTFNKVFSSLREKPIKNIFPYRNEEKLTQIFEDKLNVYVNVDTQVVL